MRFHKDDIIKCENEDMIIEDLLGEGGQGEVYLVSYKGEKYAFKIYKNEESPDFKYNLRNNIDKGSPSDKFLWPKKLITFDDGHFGYIMDLRPKRFESFVSYLTGKNTFKNNSTLISWCIELCLSFKKLHERGYSYQDLNDGSFFFDGETGDLLICDNDNITADKKNLGILGKMRYMAPEIVRGDKDRLTGERQMPDVHSDRFSLAIILFMAICLGNPFEGERLKSYDIVDEKSDLEMYGTNPVFIYHKTDLSNRPIRGYHTSVIKRWDLLPIYIKEAFHRTFVDGLLDRENERTTELEWLKLLTDFRDELMTCRKCNKQYIYGFSEKKKSTSCLYCKSKSKDICVFYIGKHKIVLEPGKNIYAVHIDKYSPDYNKVLGTVIASKNNPSLWGIRIQNCGSIEVKDSLGNTKVIEDGKVVPIVRNMKIRFTNGAVGEIR